MLDIALKEWAVVCDLLLEGKLAILLRKGGIHETGGPGVFELEHPRFALFPAWMHQRPDMLKPAYRERVQVFGHEPDEVTLRAVGEATHIWEVPDRAAFDRLDDLHPWAPAQIDMRFNYKPDRPLYLLALRVDRLAEPRTLANHPEYAGCRSWVPLRPGDKVPDTADRPAIDDADYDRLVARVDEAMGAA